MASRREHTFCSRKKGYISSCCGNWEDIEGEFFRAQPRSRIYLTQYTMNSIFIVVLSAVFLLSTSIEVGQTATGITDGKHVPSAVRRMGRRRIGRANGKFRKCSMKCRGRRGVRRVERECNRKKALCKIEKCDKLTKRGKKISGIQCVPLKTPVPSPVT